MASVNPSASVSSISPPEASQEGAKPLHKTQEDAQTSRVQLAAEQGPKNAVRASTDAETRLPVRADELSREELRSVAESFGQIVSAVNEGVSFRIDETADMLVTEIVNKETNEVIKQIPPAELVRLAGRLREFLGILLDIEV